MSDARIPKIKSDSLFAPARDRQERSDIEHSRPFSVYTAAEELPRMAIGLGLLAGLAIAAVAAARRA